MMETFWAKRTKFEVVFLIVCATLTVYAIGVGVADEIDAFKFSHLPPPNTYALRRPHLIRRHWQNVTWSQFQAVRLSMQRPQVCWQSFKSRRKKMRYERKKHRVNENRCRVSECLAIEKGLRTMPTSAVSRLVASQ
jgi:hypothetical protein